MTRNIALKGTDKKIYSKDLDSTLFALVKGTLTASPVYFSEDKPIVGGWMQDHYLEMGYSSDKALSLVKSLEPRPVYALAGRNGRVALLFGAPGGGVRNPLQAQWYRDCLARPRTEMLRQVRNGKHNMNSLEWLNGRGHAIEEYDANQHPGTGALAMWRKRALLGGVNFSRIIHSEPSTGTTTDGPSMAVPSTPVMPCGLYLKNIRYGYDYSFDGHADTQLLETQESFFTDENGAPVYKLGSKGGAVVVTDALKFDVDAARLEASYEFLEIEKPLQVGSWFPFPLTSTILGYAVGLPPDAQTIVWEGVPTALEGLPGDFGLEITSVITDVLGSDYKRMYPVSSLPEDRWQDMQAKMAELPDNIRFRVLFEPSGLEYGPVPYDGTLLARDLNRIDKDLNDLLFDHVDSGKPPVGYGSLGAMSLANINKKKNRATAITLVSTDDSLVNIARIEFTRNQGSITAMQDEYSIDSGEALVALRAGAAFSFSGVTNAEVASEFFLLPSWEDVMTFESLGGQSPEYVLDENVLSNELNFDMPNDDGLARCLPLLLGFERSDFANTVNSVCLGVLPHIKVR